MKRILFIFFIGLYSFQAKAQSDQVITVQGDTLVGKVSVFSAKNSYESIVLKIEKEKTNFKVYQIKALLMDEEVYHTIKINNTYQLGKLIKEGYLSHYNYTALDDDTSRPFSSSILIKLDGSQQIVPNLGFKKYIKKFLEDCDKVANKFEEDTYKKTELDKIVDDYNECIAENTVKLNERIEKRSFNSDKVAKINVLIASIQEDKTLKDEDTVLDMLNDVMGKLKNNSQIPSYLESALRDSLKDDSNYLEQLTKILEDE